MTVTVGPATVPSLTGFRVAFLIAAAAAVVGVLVTLLVPRRGERVDDEVPAVTPEQRRELQV
jgi:hypothetical protein